MVFDKRDFADTREGHKRSREGLEEEEEEDLEEEEAGIL